MKQYEAVINVMEANGGYATFGYLYQHVLKVPGCEWRTKTPFASIRRIVQDQRFFFRIKPGLWALKSHQELVLEKFSIDDKSPDEKKKEFNHTYYQGLLVQVGNLKGLGTFIPHQDKNKLYLSKPLSDYSTLSEFHDFTYESILRRARTVDVTWFNERRFPDSLFEVEHTTDMQNSLLKFLELQDFNVGFNIVAPKSRRQKFEQKVSYTAFAPIKTRVKFVTYEKLSAYHSRIFELAEIQKGLEL